MIILWVRAITETAGQLPADREVRVAFPLPRLSGVSEATRTRGSSSWKSLQAWAADTCFAEAKTEGWFDAVMYYAYADLRVEQAWTTWKRLKADWRHARPGTWPTLKNGRLKYSPPAVWPTLALKKPGRFGLSGWSSHLVSARRSPIRLNFGRWLFGPTLSPKRDITLMKRCWLNSAADRRRRCPLTPSGDGVSFLALSGSGIPFGGPRRGRRDGMPRCGFQSSTTRVTSDSFITVSDVMMFGFMAVRNPAPRFPTGWPPPMHSTWPAVHISCHSLPMPTAFCSL